MPELSNWNKYLVIQRDPTQGCIPTGYEWMLRMVEAKGIDLNGFQEDFNLESKGFGANNFDSIAQAVFKVYPNVRIVSKFFQEGREKVDFIRRLVENNIPCLLSLTLYPTGGWHIVPVIFIDDHVIKMIWDVQSTGKVVILELPVLEVIDRHNQWPGGDDIAWLES